MRLLMVCLLLASALSAAGAMYDGSRVHARAIEAVMRDAGVERAVLVGPSLRRPAAITFLRSFPATFVHRARAGWRHL